MSQQIRMDRLEGRGEICLQARLIDVSEQFERLHREPPYPSTC